MKKLGIAFCFVCLFFSCNSKKAEPQKKEYTTDKAEINKTIEEWDKAWGTKDLELAIKYYADKTDWTNAFGDRVESKDELKELLARIFSMDFVMTGENNYGKSEITFINDSIATVRSKNVRKNQEWPDGTKMADRHVNHLRVYQKIDGNWLIVNHMISQAWPKKEK